MSGTLGRVYLTISTSHQPATDLGFLLHKHPGRAQSFPISAGQAHVFYPVATETECTAALLMEIDPVALVRGRGASLTQYVNDRPYAAGSQLAVALRTVFATAMTGRCDQRPELAQQAIPLTIHIPSLCSRGGLDLVKRFFEPLGWQVDGTVVPLDPELPGEADSRYVDTTLTGELRLADALRHLYVLIPALDGDKHYWVGLDEAEKLLRVGDGWLAGHPEREVITARYLEHRRSYVNYALERLAVTDDVAPESVDDALAEPVVTEAPDQPLSLAKQRHGSVLAALRSSGARRVLDLGCGSGALLRVLLPERSFTELVGVDVSAKALDVAERRLKLDRQQPGRVTLRQSALTYADPSLRGYDAAVLMEVIEHIDEERLPAMEHAVFGVARPRTVILTTPNSEYNVRFETLPAQSFRHGDHRFEWTRAQFGDWTSRVAEQHGYDLRLLPVGAEDPEVGPPTQLAIFTLKEVAA